MKKIVLSLFVFLIVFSFLSYFSRSNVDNSNVISPESKLKSIPQKIIKSQKLERSIFVPYWAISGKIDKEFDPVIYFGIAPDTNGIDKEDQGYLKIEEFIKKVGKDQKKFLTVRMTDQKINYKILGDKSLQKKIIEESIALAGKYSFDGIVLDIEISSLYFESVVKGINDFSIDFYNSSKKNNLNYSVTLYGDTFYRLRPYDVSFLSKNSDKIMIMAYDFHKARGNPGPSFPLEGKNIYGYDFKSMINDFTKKIPREKIVVVFGLFGYDWMTDEKGKSINNGVPLSKNEIENKFIKKMCIKRL